jgi:hypothetical protein
VPGGENSLRAHLEPLSHKLERLVPGTSAKQLCEVRKMLMSAVKAIRDDKGKH